MAGQVYEFQMAMTCEGCAGAAKRVLGKLPEVSNVETSVEKQRVFVTSTLAPNQLLETLQKTGKECSYIGGKYTWERLTEQSQQYSDLHTPFMQALRCVQDLCPLMFS